MDPATTYTYLVRSRERVFDSVRPLAEEPYRRELPIGVKSIALTLAHIMISEWYYLQRLRNIPVPAYALWPIKYESPPAFGTIESVWRAQAVDVQAYIASEHDWARPIAWESFPDEQGQRSHLQTTASGQMTQLVLHEVHHRAQLMAMIRLLGEGVPPLEDLDFNAMMFERRPLD